MWIDDLAEQLLVAIAVLAASGRYRALQRMPSPTASIPYFGELAAIATSCSWTLCGLGFAFAGRRVGAFAVNQLRIALAVVVLFVVHAAVEGRLIPHAAPHAFFLLAASGLAGLTLGDLFYFHAISVLGPRLGALLMASAPLWSVLLAYAWLGENPGPAALLGIAAIVVGVAATVLDRRAETAWRPGAGSRRTAIAAGLLGAVGQGTGLVLAKRGMSDGDGLTPIAATLVRMTVGLAGIACLALVSRNLHRAVAACRDRRALAAIAVGVAFGPTLGVWLSLVAVRATDAGVAAALSSLSPVLMIPVARLAYGSRPSRLAVLGTIAAVAGVAVLVVAAPR